LLREWNEFVVSKGGADLGFMDWRVSRPFDGDSIPCLRVSSLKSLTLCLFSFKNESAEKCG